MIGQKEFVMGKVKYNPEFLRELAGRKNEDGRVPKNKVVAAMNADRSKRDDYEENGKSVTATQLNRWIESEKLPSFMDAIISLSNNLDGISFSDFFLEDDEPMQMVVRKGRRKKEKEQSAEPMFSETVVVRMENNLAHIGSDFRGRKQLERSLMRMRASIGAAGYEIIDLAGKPYHDGMRVEADFILDDTLPEGQQTIASVTRPQVNYEGEMIQTAHVTVIHNI